VAELLYARQYGPTLNVAAIPKLALATSSTTHMLASPGPVLSKRPHGAEATPGDVHESHPREMSKKRMVSYRVVDAAGSRVYRESPTQARCQDPRLRN
jgi:hypothetical protein